MAKKRGRKPFTEYGEDAVKEKIVQLYNDKMAVKAIARHVGLNYRTVRKYLLSLHFKDFSLERIYK